MNPLEIDETKFETNKYFNKNSKITNISGIVSMYILKCKYDGHEKYFFLFGDQHTINNKLTCKNENHIYIADWLKKFFELNNNKIMDIYLEEAFYYVTKKYKKQKIIQESKLSDDPNLDFFQSAAFTNITNTLADCISVVERNKCKYNIRYHMGDLRKLDIFNDDEKLIKSLEKGVSINDLHIYDKTDVVYKKEIDNYFITLMDALSFSQVTVVRDIDFFKNIIELFKKNIYENSPDFKEYMIKEDHQKYLDITKKIYENIKKHFLHFKDAPQFSSLLLFNYQIQKNFLKIKNDKIKQHIVTYTAYNWNDIYGNFFILRKIF